MLYYLGVAFLLDISSHHVQRILKGYKKSENFAHRQQRNDLIIAEKKHLSSWGGDFSVVKYI